jgi:adenosylcobyric acid synthase
VPRISNLDEFQPLQNVPHARVRWARTPAELAGADWVILPGSKHSSSDLAWMRERGLDQAVIDHAARGGSVLGICGGLQMLGRFLIDPHGIEGTQAEVHGLGLLDLQTEFARDKWLAPVQARFAADLGAWSGLSGQHFAGYEIHHGRTWACGDQASALRAVVFNEQDQALGWQQGSVMGLYAHGLFENDSILQALFGCAGRSLENVFEGLADMVEQHIDTRVLMHMISKDS